jgi:hypothetical protein
MAGYKWPREYVLFELPSVEGWACYNWLVEADPWGSRDRETDGYIAQEWQRKFYPD